MTLKEGYALLGGSYDELMQRMLKEDRICKYLNKLLQNPVMRNLEEALEKGDCDNAFREAHNLKGTCAMLELGKLSNSASELTEALRGGEIGADVPELWAKVQKEFKETAAIIEQMVAN